MLSESPRWLIEQGKVEKARDAMRWLRPDLVAANIEIAEIEAAMALEREMKTGLALSDMWRNPIDRRRTIIAVAAVNTQAAVSNSPIRLPCSLFLTAIPQSGAMFMIAYGTYFFAMAGIGQPFENSCILVGVGVIAILINSAVITKYGRRRVFLVTGLLLCALFQLIVAIAYTVAPGTKRTGQVIVAMSVLYIISYNGMIATYAWVSGGEIPSQRLRSYTFGLAASVGFLGAWLAT